MAKERVQRERVTSCALTFSNGHVRFRVDDTKYGPRLVIDGHALGNNLGGFDFGTSAESLLALGKMLVCASESVTQGSDAHAALYDRDGELSGMPYDFLTGTAPEDDEVCEESELESDDGQIQ